MFVGPRRPACFQQAEIILLIVLSNDPLTKFQFRILLSSVTISGLDVKQTNKQYQVSQLV